MFRHPRASVFHTPEWLEALQRTYGYSPVAFTTSPPGTELENGMAFCEVRSWLTGRRLVSLPFSDHCEPLVERAEELNTIMEWLRGRCSTSRWSYVEVRPLSLALAGTLASVSERFWWHTLDLRSGAEALFRAFSRDSIQRKIRRASREGLVYEEASGDHFLPAFYQLLVLTRQRHHLPPQPLSWFRQLAASFGSGLKVRVARKDGRPIAAMVTLRHRQTIFYKYGASDAAFHPLGGMHLLFWRTIQEGCANGCSSLDFGRSDLSNDGLVTFKNRWGATSASINYWRAAAIDRSVPAWRQKAVAWAKQGVTYLPQGCRNAAGRILYRHAG